MRILNITYILYVEEGKETRTIKSKRGPSIFFYKVSFVRINDIYLILLHIYISIQDLKFNIFRIFIVWIR